MTCLDCGVAGCACLFAGDFCLDCLGIAALEKSTEIAVLRESQDVQKLTNSLHFYNSAGGIGDAVCALYAACGAAETGLNVTFHTPHLAWLSRFSHPNLHLLTLLRAPKIDCAGDYNASLRQGGSRKQWYCDQIASARGVVTFTPALPASIDRQVRTRRVDFSEDYVAFAPYSAWPSRSWPVTHWARLAELVVRDGRRVVMVDGPCQGEAPRLTSDFGHLPGMVSFAWGMDADFVLDLILGASAMVGNDSGLTHLSGALGVPTLAIHSHVSPAQLWDMTEIVPVFSKSSCAGCGWQGARGWSSSCDVRGCSALMGIDAMRVLEALESILEKK